MEPATSDGGIPIDRKLSEIFEEGCNLFLSLDTYTEATNSLEYQEKVKKCVALLEDSTRLVSLVGVFSSNEKVEEINTSDIQYMLLPYYLGQLHLKMCGRDRKELIEIAEVYFRDYIRRCVDYELCEPFRESRATEDIEPVPKTDVEKLKLMSQQREQKLQAYRIRKELEDQIKEIRELISREHVDEDVKRDFYLKQINANILEAKEELISIQSEKDILEHIKLMKNDDTMAPKKPAPKPTPLKPIIITKDAMQKAVYGMGYPSLATMTVQEFYDQRVAEGIFPDPAHNHGATNKVLFTDDAEKEELENAEKDIKIENDDEQMLEQARAMDDFKDDHRRGYGNRHNRS